MLTITSALVDLLRNRQIPALMATIIKPACLKITVGSEKNKLPYSGKLPLIYIGNIFFLLLFVATVQLLT